MPLRNNLRFRLRPLLFWLVPLGNELRFRFRSFYLTGAVAQRVEVSAPFFFILARAVGQRVEVSAPFFFYSGSCRWVTS